MPRFLLLLLLLLLLGAAAELLPPLTTALVEQARQGVPLLVSAFQGAHDPGAAAVRRAALAADLSNSPLLVASANMSASTRFSGLLAGAPLPAVLLVGAGRHPSALPAGRDVVAWLSERSGGRLLAPPVAEVTGRDHMDHLLTHNDVVLALFSRGELDAASVEAADRLGRVAWALRGERSVTALHVDTTRVSRMVREDHDMPLPAFVLYERPARMTLLNDADTADALLRSVNERCGFRRTLDGSLDAGAGRLASLDSLASRFTDLDRSEQLQRLAAAREYVADTGRAAESAPYLETMAEVVGAGGPAAVQRGIERAQRDVDRAPVESPQHGAAQRRLNVLNAFRSAPELPAGQVTELSCRDWAASDGAVPVLDMVVSSAPVSAVHRARVAALAEALGVPVARVNADRCRRLFKAYGREPGLVLPATGAMTPLSSGPSRSRSLEWLVAWVSSGGVGSSSSGETGEVEVEVVADELLPW